MLLQSVQQLFDFDARRDLSGRKRQSGAGERRIRRRRREVRGKQTLIGQVGGEANLLQGEGGRIVVVADESEGEGKDGIRNGTNTTSEG